MGFDAGSIDAALDIDLSRFDQKLTQAEARAEKFRRNVSRPIRIGVEIDPQQMQRARQQFAQLDKQITADASQRARGAGGSLLGSLFGSLLGAGGGSAAGGGGGGGASRQVERNEERQTALMSRLLLASIGGGTGGEKNLARGTLNGAGPGILGLGTRLTGAIGLGGGLLGALPAVGAIGAGLGVIGGGAAAAISGNAALKKQAEGMVGTLKSVFQQAARPLLAPLQQAFGQIPKFLHSIAPELKQTFAAAGPLIMPLLRGIESLVKNLLPGLITLLRAAHPAFVVFGQILGTIGKALSTMFTAFAPVIRAGSTILKALAGVITGILPILGKLAALFASTLAPVFVAFAKVVRGLEPTLLLIGKIFDQLAAAVLGDLLAAFRAILQLFRAVAPALHVFASVLGQVFKLLENSGVFAILGNALESLVKPLASLINNFARGLAPILPVVIKLISTLAAMAVKVLAQGVLILLPVVSRLITMLLRDLAPELPVLTKLFITLAGILSRSLIVALTVIADVLNVMLDALQPILPILVRLSPVILGVVAAIKVWRLAQALLNVVLDANPIGLIIVAVGALVVAVVELVKHWHTVWNAIKTAASAAWNFIYNGFGKYLLPLLGPAGLIALGVIELAKHWKSIWGEIKQVGQDLWQWVYNDFALKIINVFTNTIPKAFTSAVRAIRTAWTAIQNAVKTPVNWVISHVINGGVIKAFDWISGKVGGPHINPIPTLAAGGRVTAGTHSTADDVLARISKDETVVSAAHSKILAPVFGMLGVPGYAHGGRPTAGGSTQGQAGQPPSGIFSDIGGFFGKIFDAGKILAAIFSGNTTALTHAFDDLIGFKTGGAIGDMSKLLTAIPRTLIKDVVHFLTGHFGGSGSIGGGSGSAIAAYARQYATGLGHPYVTGGFLPSGWDCSGFSAWVYEHFGYFPGGQRGRYGTSETQFASSLLQSSGAQPGALVFFDDGIYPNPGHVGVVLNNSSYVGADGHSVGTIISSLAGNVGFRIPRGGFRNPSQRAKGVASRFDSGGWLDPGMIGTNTGRAREAVLTPRQSDAYMTLAEAARRAMQHGTTGAGALLRDVYLQLPEGTTVAQALAELTFRLRMASLQAGTGGIP